MNQLSINISGLAWLVAFLIPLVFLQRGLHREIQLIILLLTRRADLSLIIFSLIFLPGVLLHEASHFLAARLLGVRTGRISVIPRPLPGGKLQLGYVETAQVDWLRESIIGMAPLMSGIAFIAYAGLVRLQLSGLWVMDRGFHIQDFQAIFKQLQNQPDFWIWFYLVLTISSMMFPSASDRRSWLPLGISLGLLLSTTIFLGAGPWMMQHLAPILNSFFAIIASLFAMSFLAHLLLYLPSLFVRLILSRASGLQVV